MFIEYCLNAWMFNLAWMFICLLTEKANFFFYAFEKYLQQVDTMFVAFDFQSLNFVWST